MPDLPGYRRGGHGTAIYFQIDCDRTEWRILPVGARHRHMVMLVVLRISLSYRRWPAGVDLDSTADGDIGNRAGKSPAARRARFYSVTELGTCQLVRRRLLGGLFGCAQWVLAWRLLSGGGGAVGAGLGGLHCLRLPGLARRQLLTDACLSGQASKGGRVLSRVAAKTAQMQAG